MWTVDQSISSRLVVEGGREAEREKDRERERERNVSSARLVRVLYKIGIEMCIVVYRIALQCIV